MLAFIGRVLWGSAKLGVKYIVVPAVISVGIAVAADAMAERIRASTPPEEPARPHGRRGSRAKREGVQGARAYS